MNAVFIPTRMRISTDRYQKMVKTGVLTKYDRVELIEGEMLEMAPIGSRHSAVSARLNEQLVLALGQSATVVVGGPVNLGQFSEPQPDLMLLKRRADFYSERIPESADVLLLIEISDSSLSFDQGAKLGLYARHGVREYWVVDINGQRFFAYLDPAQGAFRHTGEYLIGETISPQAFPNIRIALDELLA